MAKGSCTSKSRRSVSVHLDRHLDRPKLVLPIRKAYIRWQQMLEEDGLDPVQATITRLAIDGLLYIEMFGFNDLTVERRADVMAALRKMCMGAKNSGKATPKRARMNERNK
ncbi:MAG TPA: hypothetical protein VI386_38350 [Candidatus Sulfotelmatobacter sp.]